MHRRSDSGTTTPADGRGLEQTSGGLGLLNGCAGDGPPATFPELAPGALPSASSSAP